MKCGLFGVILLVLCAAFPVHAEPSIREVYAAAKAGRLSEAEAMMQQVLKAHPDSAKAHYANAEILAREHLFAQAQVELQTAEHLSPGLRFVRPRAVRALRDELAASSGSTPPVANVSRLDSPRPGISADAGQPIRHVGGDAVPVQSASPEQLPTDRHTPKIPVLLAFMILGVTAAFILGGIAILVIGVRWLWRHVGTAARAPPKLAPAYGSDFTGYSSGRQWRRPIAHHGVQGPGLLGGLAQGAAIGAGVVAGEALMERALESYSRHEHPAGSTLGIAASDNVDSGNADMGGMDFGIVSGGGWDDSSSSANVGTADSGDAGSETGSADFGVASSSGWDDSADSAPAEDSDPGSSLFSSLVGGGSSDSSSSDSGSSSWSFFSGSSSSSDSDSSPSSDSSDSSNDWL